MNLSGRFLNNLLKYIIDELKIWRRYDMNADVAVIGLGTIGSLTAWKLASRGVSVLGFEQYGLAHDRSAHGGGSRRFVVAAQVENQTEYTLASYHDYRDLERETGQELLSFGGTLTIGDPDTDRMKNVIKNAEKFNLPYEVLDEHEAAKRFPHHKLLPGEVIILDKLGGVLRPEQTIVTANNRARQLGATLHTYTKVKEILPDSTGVTIITEDENTYRVGKVIVTTGPWADELVPELRDYFSVHQIIMNWFIPEDPSGFEEERFPNFSRVSGEQHIIGTPPIDGRLVRVSHGRGIQEIESAEDYNKNIPVEKSYELRKAIGQLIPNLNPDPVMTLAFMDGHMEDYSPVVGPLSKNKNVILATGMSGSGISIGPAMSEIAVDYALENDLSFDIQQVTPARFKL